MTEKIRIIDKRGRLTFSKKMLESAGIKPGDEVTFCTRPEGGILMEIANPHRQRKKSEIKRKP